MKYLGLVLLLPALLFAQMSEDRPSHPYIRYPYAHEGLLSYWFDGWNMDYKEVDVDEVMPFLLEDERSRSYARAGNVVGWTGAIMAIASPILFCSSFAFMDRVPNEGYRYSKTSQGIAISSGVMFVVGLILSRPVKNYLLNNAAVQYNKD